MIEVAEVLRPDGTPALGADVTIELPLPESMTKESHRVRISFDTGSLTWEGKPTSHRARRYIPDQAVPAEREGMPVYEAGENAVLWIHAEGCAPWFAPPLKCPADCRTSIRARLRPARMLSGRVLKQGGRTCPTSIA